MASINFLYRSSTDKAFLKIRLFYTLNGKKQFQEASTKIFVTAQYWNNDHKKPKLKDITLKNQQTEINTSINQIDRFLNDALLLVDINTISKDWLKNQIENFYNPPQKAEALPTELLKYIDIYIDYKRNDLTKSTLTKFNGIKQLLIRYQTEKKKTVLITDVNTNFKKEFENYCLANNYATNTIARAIRFIKTFCKHAQANGLETNYQLDSIKTKNVKVESIYLTFDELEQIEKTTYTDGLNNAKDWLIISCYTGQRVSDFMRFTKEMIRYEKNKKDGILKPLIEFTQKKTGKIMTIPLHKKVVEILDKRNGEFPYSISDQKYNENIKEVCRLAGLNQLVNGSKSIETETGSKIYRKQTGTFEKWELVTSHIGRRSFASNYYGEIATTYLIYITGHSTEVMFLNYIGKSNKDIAMEMTNFF